MSGQAKFASVNGNTLALLQRVLDRMRYGKSLRAEQEESQQEVSQVLFHAAKSNS